MITASWILAAAMAADTFHGVPCTDDCSGHRAGYEWAASKGITEAHRCGGNSRSFIQGCMIYAIENGDSFGAFGGNQDACDEASNAASELESAAMALQFCAGNQDFTDDCSFEHINLQSAYSDYESAVADIEGDCD